MSEGAEPRGAQSQVTGSTLLLLTGRDLYKEGNWSVGRPARFRNREVPLLTAQIDLVKVRTGKAGGLLHDVACFSRMGRGGNSSLDAAALRNASKGPHMRMEQHNDSTLAVYGEADEATLMQMRECLDAEEGARGVLCADNHLGYSQPIGGALAYRNHISVTGVGYDIGCGNGAVKTDIDASDLDLPAVMDEIHRQVSFGMGRKDGLQVDHPVLDAIAQAEFAPQRKLLDLARKQLGTVGAGNHYVDLFRDDRDGKVWVGVHFGSRGFGHKTAKGFLAMARGGSFDNPGKDGESATGPVLLDTSTEAGQSYIEAMKLAGAYAQAGREVVLDTVGGILGAQASQTVHNHHNFAWSETHDDEEFWVVRKGCTPAFPGQEGFVGASMAEAAVILEGTESGGDGLFSTVHGAGRVMSRTQAAGKKKMKQMCGRCQWVQPPHTPKADECPSCGSSSHLHKRWVQVKPGEIQFDEVQQELAQMGIELRGGGADEAPAAYKRLDQVLAAHGDTIQVKHRLIPIGVAMAGEDIFDPFKD